MDTTWQRSILAALVYSLLLSYIVAMPAARILFTIWPKKSLRSCYILPQHIFRFKKKMVKMITKFKSIRKKSDILNAGHGLKQCSPLRSPCTHSGAQAKERKFTIFTQAINAICSPPSKFCITIVFNFSWDDCNTREKLETMAMQSLGATKVDYGLNVKMVNTVLLFISSNVFQWKS